MKIKKDIAIIGGGPAGLMAAGILASAGHGVTVYDRMPSPGRKLLMAGRGGLNLTHSEPLDDFIKRYREASAWLEPSIRAFPPQALQAWCEDLEQELFIGSSGRVFPKAMKAAPLLRAWLKNLDQLGVRFALRHHWHGWEGDALHLTNAEKEKLLVKPDATLLTLGGASWPSLGTDGGWVDIFSANDIPTTPLKPANCGFIVPWTEHFATRFAGQPLKPVKFTFNGVSRQGEAMITKRGIEGGLIYAFGAPLREAIIAKGSTVLQLDLSPHQTLEALERSLHKPRGSKSLSTFLQKAGLPPVATGLLYETIPREALARATPAELAAWLKALPVTLTEATGLQRAISTAGGIPESALNENFMLRAKPGVFAAGEMLDWEAPTGGFLLQACFSTAVAAANGMLAFLAR